MGRLLDENDVYALFAPNGTARLHVADIDALPRVDAKEVVHGRWLYEPVEFTYEKDIKRSVCGRYVDEPENYCPNCGARMDLEDKE